MTLKHKVSILFTTQILQLAEVCPLGPRWLGPWFFQAVGSQGMWWQCELHHVLKQCSAELSLTETPATSTSPFRCLTTVAVLFYCRFECIFLLNSFSSLFAGEIQMCFSGLSRQLRRSSHHCCLSCCVLWMLSTTTAPLGTEPQLPQSCLTFCNWSQGDNRVLEPFLSKLISPDSRAVKVSLLTGPGDNWV